MEPFLQMNCSEPSPVAAAAPDTAEAEEVEVAEKEVEQEVEQEEEVAEKEVADEVEQEEEEVLRNGGEKLIPSGIKSWVSALARSRSGISIDGWWWWWLSTTMGRWWSTLLCRWREPLDRGE